MSLASKLLSASGGAVDKVYVDDVFSSFTRTGTGATTTIQNNIDTSSGGLLWSKSRSAAGNNVFVEIPPYTSSAAAAAYVVSNSTSAAASSVPSYFEFTKANKSYGFNGDPALSNTNGTTYVDFVFRKAPKFFDIVTYTGNGVAGRQIPHALGIAPGMVVVKATSSAGDWHVVARYTDTNYIGGGAANSFSLNTTAIANNGVSPSDRGITSTHFDASKMYGGVGSFDTSKTNSSGVTYVAYLFAHDTSADGLIQCGSFTTDASGNATVTLGWEPQFILQKASEISAGGGENWQMHDVSRAWCPPSSLLLEQLRANTSEQGGVSAQGGAYPWPTATGFKTDISQSWANKTFIYLAIRRPNKPPTLGTQVYNAIARTGTGAAEISGVGFTSDLVVVSNRSNDSTDNLWAGYKQFIDRLRGAGVSLQSTTIGAEGPALGVTSLNRDGISVGNNYYAGASGLPYSYHFFKRAVGVFDEVCYTGTGVAKTEAHGLGVVPELIIVKSRSAATQWPVYVAPLGNSSALWLSETGSQGVGVGYWNSTSPTSTVLSIFNGAPVNAAAATYVAYLFASKAGISKVFSYTGNGTSQTIDCAFTTGARFVLIKRTDAAGDWYVWDTVRGIVAANDPHLSLNSTAAEVTTDDSVDPASVGFTVNQLAATNINVNGAVYIGLAYA